MFKTQQFADDASAAAAGFADFNDCPHLAVDVPRGSSTVTIRTPEGRRLTVALLPYTEGGEPECADVVYHSGDTTSWDGKTLPVQDVVMMHGGYTGYDSRPDPAKDRPLITTILMEKHNG